MENEIKTTNMETFGCVTNWEYDSKENFVTVIKYYDNDEEAYVKSYKVEEEVSSLINWLFYEQESYEEDIKKLREKINQCQDLKIAMEYQKELHWLISHCHRGASIALNNIQKVEGMPYDE